MKAFTNSENKYLKSNGKPEKIQKILDSLKYRTESIHLPATFALREWKAHCFDGSLLAAAALRRAGYKAFIIDLCAVEDDDHLLCAYQWKGYWGAVAKSNFPGLRFREPVYKTPRELVMSYFEIYFNLKRKKSLRKFSKPFPLPDIKKLNWEADINAIDIFLNKLDNSPHYNILSTLQVRNLNLVDNRLMKSQMIGVSLDGARGGKGYRVEKEKLIKKPIFI